MLAAKKSILYLTTFSLALALGLVTISPIPTLAESQLTSSGNNLLGSDDTNLPFPPQIAKVSAPTSTKGSRLFDPPDGGATPSTAGGGTRGGSCILNNKKSIVPLMPSKNSVLTVSAYPTFFAYIPESTAQTARLVVREQGEDDALYDTTFNLPRTSGIVSVTLPNAALPPLKVGHTYHWFLVLVCDTEDGSQNAIADGWIKRIEPSVTLEDKLEKTPLRDRPKVYGKAGIWQETLTTLAQLRRSSPTDPAIAAEWEKLLREVELSEVAKAPLVDCCTVQN